MEIPGLGLGKWEVGPVCSADAAVESFMEGVGGTGQESESPQSGYGAG